MVLLHILIFVASLAALYWSGSKLVRSLSKICHVLGWREFVVAFFIMSVATSIPNLVVDISAALRGIPQLAFGDIVGGNIVDLTLVIGLAVILSNISLPTESRMVQTSAAFTIGIALIPLLLIIDGAITRVDGIILIMAFFLYSVWLFGNKKEVQQSVLSSQKREKRPSENPEISFRDRKSGILLRFADTCFAGDHHQRPVFRFIYRA